MTDSEISWFHGLISRENAGALVEELGVEGGFLVRASSTSPGDYVITLLHNGEIEHYQVRKHGEDAFFSIDDERIFHGLETLIQFLQEEESNIGTKLTQFCANEPPPHDARRHGRTNLLHRATNQGNYKVVTELLNSRHRSIEAKNQDGQTAVHLASRAGHNDILQQLLERGANVNCRDSAGNTPLHYACQNNHATTVRLLVQTGLANVQARNAETGWVPMHDAASRGHSEIVQLLLTLNVPLRPRTNLDETPLMLAKPFPECAQILENYQPVEPTLKKESWYHGTLTRDEAVELIAEKGNQDGSYLVRYSDNRNASPGGKYVLTLFVSGQTYHFAIKKDSKYFFIDDGPLFDSLEYVVDYYSKMQDGLPTVLQFPIPPRPKPPVPEIPPWLPTMSLGRRTSTPQMASSSRFGCSAMQSIRRLHVATPKEPGCISTARLSIGDKLGEGNFATVYKGTYTLDDNTKIQVAIKTLRDDTVGINKEQFLQEAALMTSLNHHYVVKLIGLSRGPPLMMVQELEPLGSMLAYLNEFRDRVNPNYELKLWASQIASGMVYLTSQKFIHRDLAARNILLSARHHAKISDFGLSRVVSGEYYRNTAGGYWPIKWYAPESYNFGIFSHGSDVWSYGVTLWEMYSYGEQPYGDLKGSEVIKQVDSGERLKRPFECPQQVYDVMQKCWSYNVEDRPTFAELFTIFAQDIDYTNVRELLEETLE